MRGFIANIDHGHGQISSAAGLQPAMDQHDQQDQGNEDTDNDLPMFDDPDATDQISKE